MYIKTKFKDTNESFQNQKEASESEQSDKPLTTKLAKKNIVKTVFFHCLSNSYMSELLREMKIWPWKTLQKLKGIFDLPKLKMEKWLFYWEKQNFYFKACYFLKLLKILGKNFLENAGEYLLVLLGKKI